MDSSVQDREKKKRVGEGVRGRLPALAGTREYEQGVMIFGMSRRIKPKETYVRISLKEI